MHTCATWRTLTSLQSIQPTTTHNLHLFPDLSGHQSSADALTGRPCRLPFGVPLTCQHTSIIKAMQGYIYDQFPAATICWQIHTKYARFQNSRRGLSLLTIKESMRALRCCCESNMWVRFSSVSAGLLAQMVVQGVFGVIQPPQASCNPHTVVSYGTEKAHGTTKSDACHRRCGSKWACSTTCDGAT